MEKFSTKKVMGKLDMFQSIFGKIDGFGWWYLEIISVDAGTQFTLAEFKEECQTRRVHLMLAAPEHQEINEQVEVPWRTLLTIARSLTTCSGSRRTFFLHALSFQCTSKLCLTFLNLFLVYFHILRMHNTI